MPELAGEAGLAAVDASVDDDAHAQAPVHVDQQHVPGSDAGPLEVLAVGHRLGVVDQEERQAHLFL